jgi:hypothetical protein
LGFAERKANLPDEKLSYTRGVLDKIRASYDKLSREELLDLICYLSKTYVVEQTIPFDVPIPERENEAPEPMAEPALLSQDRDRDRGDASSDVATTGTPTQRFAQLIDGLKRRTQLPQLEHFTIEDGRCVLTVDNQKVTFGDRVTVEFVPQRGRTRPSGETPAAAMPRPETAPQAEAPPPGARPGLPGGDGRTRQGGGRPFDPEPRRAAPGAPPPSRDGARAPAAQRPAAGVPEKKDDKDKADLTDVDHIVERFRRLDLD